MVRACSGRSDTGRRPRVGTLARHTVMANLDAVWDELVASATGPCAAERIHRLRVSTRRGLASLSLFRDLMPPKPRRWFRRRLRLILRAAAGVRDLDLVLHHLAGEGLAAVAEGAPAYAGRARLLDLVASRRVAATVPVRRLHTLIGQRRWSAHRAHLVAGIQAAEASPAEQGEQVRRRLRQRVKAFIRCTHGTSTAPRAIHRLRLAGKKLRYTVEALSGASPHPTARRCLAALRRLQGVLGKSTDHATAVETIRGLARTPELRTARRNWDCLRRAEQDEARQALRAFTDWWDRDQRHDLRRRCRLALRKAFA
jgi:CHAD domain-containing protein